MHEQWHSRRGIPVCIVITVPVYTVSAVPLSSTGILFSVCGSAHCSLCAPFCALFSVRTVLRTVLWLLFCALFCTVLRTVLCALFWALFSFDCTPFRILLAGIIRRMQTLQTRLCMHVNAFGIAFVVAKIA